MVTEFRNFAAALAVTAAFGAAAAPAGAQMFERAYDNNQRDGLGMAIVMKQVDEGLFSPQQNVTSSGSAAPGDILLCGSDESTSTATANSSCIIIGDGATAIIDMGQDSLGDQDANSDSTTTVSGEGGDLSDALEALNGG